MVLKHCWQMVNWQDGSLHVKYWASANGWEQSWHEGGGPNPPLDLCVTLTSP